MLLNRLQMRNFKRYRDQDLRFKDGITGIVGNNGSGKSTIVDAILFAFYGVQGTGLDSEFIVSAFAGPLEKAVVCLEFSLGGDDFLVLRTFGRKGGPSHTAKFYHKKKLMARGVIQVHEKIHQLLHMGPADFRHTIFSGQKDLSALLDTNRERRKAWFRKVLGIDCMKEDGGKILRDEREILAARRERLRGTLESISPDAVRARRDAIGREIQVAEDRKDALRKESLALDRQVPDLDRRIHDLREAQARQAMLIREQGHLRLECDRLRKEREDRDREIADLNRLVPEYRDLAETEPAFGETQAALEEMNRRRAEQERLAGQRGDAQVRIRDLEEQIAAAGKELEQIQRDETAIRELEPRVARRDEVLATLQAQNAREERFHTLREATIRAEHDLEGFRLQGATLRERIEGLKRDREALGALERELSDDGELRERAVRMARARELDLQREGIRLQADAAREEIANLDGAIRELDRGLAGAEEVSVAIPRLEEERSLTDRRMATAAASIQARRSEVEEAERHLAGILELGPESACPTCHQPLRDHYGLLLQELQDSQEKARIALQHLEDEQSGLAENHTRVSLELIALAADRDRHRQQEGERRTLADRRKIRAMNLQRLEEQDSALMAAIRALGIDCYDPEEHNRIEHEMGSREGKREEVARLRHGCAQMPPLLAEWDGLQAKTLSRLTEREGIDREIRELGHDASLVRSLEEERDSLEDPWREYLVLRERIQRKGILLEYNGTLRKNTVAAREMRDRLSSQMASLEYDRDRHLALEKYFARAQADHERYLALKPRIEMLPERQDRMDRAAAALAGAEGELARLEGRIAELVFHEEDLAAATSEREMVERELRDAGIALERCMGDLRRFGEQRTDLDGSLERAEKASREIGEIDREMELLDLTRDLIGQFTDHLLGVVRDRIQDETSRILSDITDGRYDAVLIDDDFTLLVHDLGGDFPAGRFSGGEQDDIAVAFRIALSRYLAEMHGIPDATFLIFDEIFGSQDEERRSNLFRALRTQEAHFPQIFLISHIPDVQGEFSNLLVVEAGPDGTSTVRSPDDGG